MDQIFLYAKGKQYSYHEMDLACAALKTKLPPGNNKKVVVLSAQPALYYLAFYFCFTHDFIYCPVGASESFSMQEDKIAIINPGVIITDEQAFLSNWREKDQVYEPVQLPSFGSFFLCFGETEIPDNFSTEDVRYILFTAGINGAAKGVPVSNSNIAAYTDNMQELFEVEETAVIANPFDFVLDLSILTMLMAWNNRAAVAHIAIHEPRLAHSDCSILCLMPSMLRDMQKKLLLHQFIAGKIKHILFCGEPLMHADLQLVQEHFPLAGICNCYGPTELTIFCVAYKMQAPFHIHNGLLSIGKLNIGSKAYISDAMILSNHHVEGELCLTGEQLFKGYINVPNSERFFDFNGERYFKTGDKVIYNREDDLYFYAAHIDQEIKVYNHQRIWRAERR